jgi:hypothetical protein
MQKIINGRSTDLATEDIAHRLKAHACFGPKENAQFSVLRAPFPTWRS